MARNKKNIVVKGWDYLKTLQYLFEEEYYNYVTELSYLENEDNLDDLDAISEFQEETLLDIECFTDFVRNELCDCDITGGASRLCLLPYDYKYVFKCEISYKDEDTFNDKEVSVYNEAKDYNDLKRFFAESLPVGKSFSTITLENGKDINFVLNIIAMERVECSISKFYKLSESFMLSGADSDFCEDESVISTDLASNFLCRDDMVTGEDLYELSDFLDALEINDLHDGNVGYKDNNIVLIDYAGF